MLQRLSVRNLAVVEEAEVVFGPSLNVITGETGAGKSVLMGALELVLGGRADASVVREGAKEAEVEADFGDRVIRRTVTREGRSRAWIDDESVSVSELREIGRSLVDIHGPTANQRLLEEAFQRETLDAYGRAESAIAAYGAAWAAFCGIVAEIEALTSAGGEEELDLLRFQVGELESAGLSEEDETLAERHAAVAHAEEIIENANVVMEMLGGDRGAAESLAELQPRFRALARHLPRAEEWAREADEIALRIQELSRTIADIVSRQEVGEEDLASLDARLTTVSRLQRKYRAETVARLMEMLAEKKAKLESLEGRDERLQELEARRKAAAEEVRTAGAALTRVRKTAASKLAAAITKELKDLGFLQAKFGVKVEPQEPAAHGCDRVVYMFEPNPGEPARPLASIASSGEVARVMLAVKTVVTMRGASADETASQTLVFDEIDANIGGEVGRIVGEKLRAVARVHQIVAITHLPQSAVYGARHLVVSKGVSEGRTRTTISSVEGDARVTEIARMLGGEKLTSVTRKHAEELLSLSR